MQFSFLCPKALFVWVFCLWHNVSIFVFVCVWLGVWLSMCMSICARVSSDDDLRSLAKTSSPAGPWSSEYHWASKFYFIICLYSHDCVKKRAGQFKTPMPCSTALLVSVCKHLGYHGLSLHSDLLHLTMISLPETYTNTHEHMQITAIWDWIRRILWVQILKSNLLTQFTCVHKYQSKTLSSVSYHWGFWRLFLRVLN